MPLTESKQQLVTDNISYAEALVRKLFSKHARFLDIEDMLCEACTGLCVAAQRYDETSNIKFTTYAYFYIFKFVVEYIKRESKKLYGSTQIKDNSVIVCGLDTVSTFLCSPDSIDICEWDIIIKELNYEERCVFAYKVSGYTKAQINKETGIPLQRVDICLSSIKKIIAEKLDREDLMSETNVVEQPQKKKRGRPKKVTLEVVQTAAQIQSSINVENSSEQIDNNVSEVDTKDIIETKNTQESENIKEYKNTIPDFLFNYDIRYNVGDTVYAAVFCGEPEVRQLSLYKEFKYRVKSTKITSVILKTDNQVCYTTLLSKKTHIESDKIFKTEQECKDFCNTLNKRK